MCVISTVFGTQNTHRVFGNFFLLKMQNRGDFHLTRAVFFGYNAHIIQEQTKSQRTTARGEKP